jgi:hypothetical protein
MLTEIVAIYAAVVSTVSIVITYFAYRSENPKLSGSVLPGGRGRIILGKPYGPTIYSQDEVEFEVPLVIAINNRGRAPITIESASASCIVCTRKRYAHPAENSLEFPIRIDGNSGVRGLIITRGRSEEVVSADGGVPIYSSMHIELGTGKTLFFDGRSRVFFDGGTAG